MSIFPPKKNCKILCFFQKPNEQQKNGKWRKKWKFQRVIDEKNVNKLFSVYEWYLLFCVIQRREITKNEERRVFVWVVWSIMLKIVSYNPKQNVVITCRFQNKNGWKMTTNLFLGMKSGVFFWKNTVFVINRADTIPKKDVKN